MFTPIDLTNKALYEWLHADSTLLGLAPGDVWDGKADEGTPLPYVVFQRVTGVPDYTMQSTVSSDRQVYMAKAYAEDTPAKTGQEQVAQIVDRLKTRLLNAALSIAGNTVLAVYPTSDLPSPVNEPPAEGRSKDTYAGGFYFDVVAA